MTTDMWTLFNAKKADIYASFPLSRRLLDLGFDLDPRMHRDGQLALISPNQHLLLNLTSGDFAPILKDECHA